MNLAGLLIRKERLRRDWSQEGLCKGICAVSYLSKIEQGKIVPSDEILEALFSRLGIHWENTGKPGLEERIKRCWEALLSGNKAAFQEEKRQLDYLGENLQCSPFMIDILLLDAFAKEEPTPLDEELECLMDQHQLALQRILQRRFDEAAVLWPIPYTHLVCGEYYYKLGRHVAALEVLRQAYDTAAEEGYPFLMLDSRIYMGNCCSNMQDIPRMLQHYTIAKRLARALKQETVVEELEYNIAATSLECGRTEEAYRYFSQKDNLSVMGFHKLAICCEKLGKPDEAFTALDAAEKRIPDDAWEPALAHMMLDLVRYRLEHPDYLKDACYGTMLLQCFQELKEKLPIGYAVFHMPWVMEWYKANRQYRQACALLENFPEKIE